jgi:hypothetical protein
MKTKMKICGTIVLFLVIALLQTKTARQSDVALLNIEALATGEFDRVRCIYTGSLDCPIGNDKVYMVIY